MKMLLVLLVVVVVTILLVIVHFSYPSFISSSPSSLSSSLSSSVYCSSHFSTLFSFKSERYKLGRNSGRRIDRVNCAGVATPLLVVPSQVCVFYAHVCSCASWRNIHDYSILRMCPSSLSPFSFHDSVHYT